MMVNEVMKITIMARIFTINYNNDDVDHDNDADDDDDVVMRQ